MMLKFVLRQERAGPHSHSSCAIVSKWSPLIRALPNQNLTASLALKV